MPRTRLTRRRALQAGALAVAAGALRPGRAAARRVPVAFEVDLESRAAVAAGGWRTLPVMRAPRRFDLVGLRWTAGRAPARAEVRARRINGPWSPWTPLHAQLDHAPDGKAAPAGTEPCWTGSADLFQVRLSGRPAGLRARFVRVRPQAELARRSSARLRRARASQASPGSAPRIITRTEWGGDDVPPRSDPSYGEVQVAFVHHTVTANDYAPEDSAAIVLGICRYHRDHNKWNDIGYNFLVDQYGQVFEGRAGGVDQAVIGAQAQGYNRLSTGVACLGTYEAPAFPEAGVDAVSRLIAWKLPLHGVPVTGEVTVISGGGDSNRYPNGAPVTLQRISGHRDGCETACPGDALYAQLPDIRNRAAALAVPVSALVVRATRPRVKAPRPVLVAGTLRFSDGAPAGGKPIDLQFQAAGGGWTPAGQTITAGDGSWSASVPATTSGLVRGVFPGDDAHPPLEGNPVAVTVLPRLTLQVDPRRTPAGEAARITGTLEPVWPPKIQLVLERRAGRGWATVQRKKINVRGGRFATTVRPKRAGLHRVTIEAPGASIKRLLRAV